MSDIVHHSSSCKPLDLERRDTIGIDHGSAAHRADHEQLGGEQVDEHTVELADKGAAGLADKEVAEQAAELVGKQVDEQAGEQTAEQTDERTVEKTDKQAAQQSNKEAEKHADTAAAGGNSHSEGGAPDVMGGDIVDDAHERAAHGADRARLGDGQTDAGGDNTHGNSRAPAVEGGDIIHLAHEHAALDGGGDGQGTSVPAQTDRVIGRLAKNTREAISVVLCAFRGHRFIDVRIMVAGKDSTLPPTAKGVTIKADILPALIALLEQARGRPRARWQALADRIRPSSI